MKMLKKLVTALGLEVYSISVESFIEQFGKMMELEWNLIMIRLFVVFGTH